MMWVTAALLSFISASASTSAGPARVRRDGAGSRASSCPSSVSRRPPRRGELLERQTMVVVDRGDACARRSCMQAGMEFPSAAAAALPARRHLRRSPRSYGPIDFDNEHRGTAADARARRVAVGAAQCTAPVSPARAASAAAGVARRGDAVPAPAAVPPVPVRRARADGASGAPRQRHRDAPDRQPAFPSIDCHSHGEGRHRMLKRFLLAAAHQRRDLLRGGGAAGARHLLLPARLAVLPRSVPADASREIQDAARPGPDRGWPAIRTFGPHASSRHSVRSAARSSSSADAGPGRRDQQLRLRVPLRLSGAEDERSAVHHRHLRWIGRRLFLPGRLEPLRGRPEAERVLQEQGARDALLQPRGL